jgi:hypothetical protein
MGTHGWGARRAEYTARARGVARPLLVVLARGQFSKQIAKMADKSCTIRTRKFLTNRLLQRKQFVSAAERARPPRGAQICRQRP